MKLYLQSDLPVSQSLELIQDEDDAVEDMAYNPIRTFHHDIRPHAIAWSPETSLSVVPKILMFCVAGADFKIRLYNSNLSDVNEYEVRKSMELYY